MRSKSLGYVIAFSVGLLATSVASAQSKNRGKGSASSGAADKTIDKQMEWERKVMGDDSAKAADMRKIAAAQKLADEAAKNPPPIQAPKPKDPNKEGVRAKQEAAIGLPIASDQDVRPSKKSTNANSKKSHPPASSTDDELGALVASSLAEGKSTGTATASAHHSKPHPAKGQSATKGKAHAKSAGRAPSTLDQMFANSN